MLPPPVSSSSSSTSASLSTATTSSKRRRANFAAPSLSSSSSSSSSSLSSRVSSAVIPDSRLLQMPRSILEKCIGGFLEMSELCQMRYVCRQLHIYQFHCYGPLRMVVTEKSRIPDVVNKFINKYVIYNLNIDGFSNSHDELSVSYLGIEYYGRICSQVLLTFPFLRELTVLSAPPVKSNFALSNLRTLNIDYFSADSERGTFNFFVGCSSVSKLCINQFLCPVWRRQGQPYLAMFNQLTCLSIINDGGPPVSCDAMTGVLGTPPPPLEVLNIPICRVSVSWVCSLSSLKELHVASCIDDVSEVGPSSSSELSQLSSSSLSSPVRSSNIFFESAALPHLNALTITEFDLLGLVNIYGDRLVAPCCTALTALNIKRYNSDEQSLSFNLSNCTNLISLSLEFNNASCPPRIQPRKLVSFLKTGPLSLRKLSINNWLGISLSLPLSGLTELSIKWGVGVPESKVDLEKDCPNIVRASFESFPLATLFQFTRALTYLSVSKGYSAFKDEFFNTLPRRAPGLRSLEIIQERLYSRSGQSTILGPYRLPIQHPTLMTLCFKEQWYRQQKATLIFIQRAISGHSYLVKYPDNPFYVVTDSRIPESSRWPLSVYAATKTSTGPLLWTRFIIDNNDLRIES